MFGRRLDFLLYDPADGVSIPASLENTFKIVQVLLSYHDKMGSVLCQELFESFSSTKRRSNVVLCMRGPEGRLTTDC